MYNVRNIRKGSPGNNSNDQFKRIIVGLRKNNNIEWDMKDRIRANFAQTLLEKAIRRGRRHGSDCNKNKVH